MSVSGWSVFVHVFVEVPFFFDGPNKGSTISPLLSMGRYVPIQ